MIVATDKMGEAMDVELAGRTVQIEGDPSDGYFAAVEDVARNTTEIVAMLAGVPEEAVIFDVGANIGVIAMAMAIVRPRARIVAFEPSPAILPYLRKNVAPFANVEVVQAAISDRHGVLRFHAATFAAGSHVVGPGHILPSTETVEVQALPLDSFAAQRGLTPDLIKIDVEGHEPEVLAGAAATIESARPEIAMEFNSWTLAALGGHNPATFAHALWESFDVDGFPRALEFLHDNLVVRSCLTDIVMRLKPGAKVPSLSEMCVSPLARELVRREFTARPLPAES
ncbi:FkbM family methyltransferase [Sphingomonas profundi]|uniref:FkbM family methyltransferase n=1 Tax=Alterirhizorhabdus profundi TaxID=2681549 RepID=UPI0018D16A0D|nr:FkbM family methyltransferase [Sphingomonas profundi]